MPLGLTAPSKPIGRPPICLIAVRGARSIQQRVDAAVGPVAHFEQFLEPASPAGLLPGKLCLPAGLRVLIHVCQQFEALSESFNALVDIHFFSAVGSGLLSPLSRDCTAGYGRVAGRNPQKTVLYARQTWRSATPGDLIFRRMLRMVDYQNVHRPLGGFQLEPGLLLESFE